jgi:hypothetical protein
VTLSAPVIYANNSDYGLYANIVGLSASSYLLLYYDSYQADGPATSGPLNAILATISSSSGEISLSAATSWPDSALMYYFEVAAVDNSTVLLAYVDANSNYGVRTQVIRVLPQLNGSTYENVIGDHYLSFTLKELV